MECHEGYYTKNGVCIALSSSDPKFTNGNTGVLYYDTTTSSVLIRCFNGWYFNQIGSIQGCFPDINHCDIYSTLAVSICITCDFGYVVTSSGSACLRDNSSLSNCWEVSSSDPNFCIRCNSEAFIATAGVCVTRVTFITNCSSHSPSSNLCQLCNSAYYVSPTYTACTTRVLGTGCLTTFVNADKCLTCSSAYYLSTATSTCIIRTAITNCLTTNITANTCAQCSATYYVNGTGTCTLRTIGTTNCRTPSVSANTCAECYTNYYKTTTGTCLTSSLTTS